MANLNRLYNTYCATWDAYYNTKTGEWEEKKCSDPACIFCVDRPALHDKHCERCIIDQINQTDEGEPDETD